MIPLQLSFLSSLRPDLSQLAHNLHPCGMTFYRLLLFVTYAIQLAISSGAASSNAVLLASNLPTTRNSFSFAAACAAHDSTLPADKPPLPAGSAQKSSKGPVRNSPEVRNSRMNMPQAASSPNVVAGAPESSPVMPLTGPAASSPSSESGLQDAAATGTLPDSAIPASIQALPDLSITANPGTANPGTEISGTLGAGPQRALYGFTEASSNETPANSLNASPTIPDAAPSAAEASSDLVFGTGNQNSGAIFPGDSFSAPDPIPTAAATVPASPTVAPTSSTKTRPEIEPTGTFSPKVGYENLGPAGAAPVLQTPTIPPTISSDDKNVSPAHPSSPAPSPAKQDPSLALAGPGHVLPPHPLGNNPLTRVAEQPPQVAAPTRATASSPQTAYPDATFSGAPAHPAPDANTAAPAASDARKNEIAAGRTVNATSSAATEQPSSTKGNASQSETSGGDTPGSSPPKGPLALALPSDGDAPAALSPTTIALADPALQVASGQPGATSGSGPGSPSNAATASGNPPAIAAPPGDLPGNAVSGPVQMAQMVSRTAQSEMRIGLNTAAFGNVEVRTVVHGNEVGIMIGSEKGDLRALLSNELPGIASTLQQQNLRLNPVNFHRHQQGFAFSNQMSSGGDAQARSFTRRAAPAISGQETGAGEFVQSGDTPGVGPSTGSLSILA